VNEAVTIEKIWAILGKTFMEREVAFKKIDSLTSELEELKKNNAELKKKIEKV